MNERPRQPASRLQDAPPDRDGARRQTPPGDERDPRQPPPQADRGRAGLELWRRAVAAGWPVLLLAVAGLLPGALAAQPPTQPATSEEPWGLALLADGEEPRPAPLLATDIDVRVTGVVARGRVSQRFRNPGTGWVEGVYTFPLPDSAAVDSLRMVVGDRIIEGEIREREEAQRVYEEARREGQRASLVRQSRPNVFTARLANVGPGDEVTVELEYQHLVRWDSGLFRLRVPTVVAPRFDPGPPPGPPAGPQVAALQGDAAHLDSPFDAAHLDADDRADADAWVPAVGLARPGGGRHPLRLTVELEAGFPLAGLDSPYHPIEVAAAENPGASGAVVRVSLAAGDWQADRDFELLWAPLQGDEPRAVVFSEDVDGEVFALLMVVPPVEDPRREPPPREVLFVVDTSGSMAGASLEQAKGALLAALGRLRPQDTFNLLRFSDHTQALFARSWPAEGATLDQARRWVQSLRAGGGTVMQPALEIALSRGLEGYGSGPGDGALRQVVFITDGAVSNEAELYSTIEGHLGQTRLFTVGIGSAPNGHFMRAAAHRGRGTYTFIGSPDAVAPEMAALLTKLEQPALTGVEVHFDDAGAEIYPQPVPDLYVGEPVVVTARLGWRGEAVRLSGRRGEERWEHRVDLAEASATGVSEEGGTSGGASPEVGGTSGLGLAKLWARGKIDGLLAARRRAPAPSPENPGPTLQDQLRGQVVELALRHGLVSPFTSLVAVDRTPARPASEPLARRSLAGLRPAGWTDAGGSLPVGATSARFDLAAGLALLGLALLLRLVLGRGREVVG